MANVGRIVAVSGPLVTAAFDQPVVQNEVGYAEVDGLRLKAELIRVRGDTADLQVFEDTTGLFVGGRLEFTGEMLSAELGPGLLGLVVDGLQNPLVELAEASGYFLARGQYLAPIDRERRWTFTPSVEAGASVRAGDALGTVPEGVIEHRIMVPFGWGGWWTVREVAAAGELRVDDVVATLEDEFGRARDVTMVQRWPVKLPIRAYHERLRPERPLVTKIRIVDTLFPVARGGTYCIPGPFGAGKTVLQQLTSRHAEVDVVVVAACGERAGEVVETLREFPEIVDPRTGRSLMERTVIVCNTSSMPVAAREASVYTAVTSPSTTARWAWTCCSWPTRPAAGRRPCARSRGGSRRSPARRPSRRTSSRSSRPSTSAAAWCRCATARRGRSPSAAPSAPRAATSRSRSRRRPSRSSAPSTGSRASARTPVATRRSTRSTAGATTPAW
jgi:V/A-type H+/Na+-transporting ATPase subunit A